MLPHHTYICTGCYKALREECNHTFRKCPWCGSIMIELSYKVHIPKIKKRKAFLEWYWKTFPGALETLNNYKSRQGL